MIRLTTRLMAATALIAVAGCVSKPKEIAQLPPSEKPPVVAEPAPMPAQPVTDTVVPGSAADFKRTAQSDTIHFAYDMFDIDDESRAILDSQAAWLTRFPQVRATVEGHCDERGTREYNLALGERRANAAKNYLVAKGVDPSRLTVVSYGKERPVALGSDEASWAQNRRAVTLVLS